MAVLETSSIKEKNTMLVQEAVGVFDGYDDLFETIKDLGSNGFGRHQISVRGSDAAVAKNFGQTWIVPEMIEDNPDAPRSAIIGAEELGVAQGVLIGASMYLGAALAMFATDGLTTPNALWALILSIGLAGLAGGVLAQLLGTQYKRFFQKQEAAGGLVLWVSTPDEKTCQKAESILQKHGAHDVHTHVMPIAA